MLGRPDIDDYPPGTSHYCGSTIPVKWCGLFLHPQFPLPLPGCPETDRKTPWWLQITFDEEDVVQNVEIEKGDAAREGYEAVRQAYLRDKERREN